ncbi:MAG TPA: hypothetical protein VII67_01000 [Acidimicrobiales bacterium]
MLAHEADADHANTVDGQVQIVKPQRSVLIHNPPALTSTGLTNPAAVALYVYLYSDAGQTIWVYNHFRTSLLSLQSAQKDVFDAPKNLTLESKLGGWTTVTNTFFAPTRGIVTKIESAHGFTS